MSDEINRDINGMPVVVYPIQKIYFGQETETEKTPLLDFNAIPEGSGLTEGSVGTGTQHSGAAYYESDFILTKEVMEKSTGSLFWDSNGRLIKGKCNFNANVKGDRNEAATLLAAADDEHDPANAKSSTDDGYNSVTTHTGGLRNNQASSQSIDAHLHRGANGKYIFFNDANGEALSGYYGNIRGYNKITGVLETDPNDAKIEITGLNANEIKKGVTYFGVEGTFSGVLGELEAKSYINDNEEYLPEGEYDGWNKVTTTQVKVTKTESAPYTYYIGEIKSTP